MDRVNDDTYVPSNKWRGLGWNDDNSMWQVLESGVDH